MRFVTLNLIFATWLLISAFAFPQTPFSTAFTALSALVVAVAAFAAQGKPGVRYVISVVAVLLAIGALFLTGVSGIARVSNALVGAVLFAISLVRPGHAATPQTPAASSP
jgi:phage-related minor tail protein